MTASVGKTMRTCSFVVFGYSAWASGHLGHGDEDDLDELKEHGTVIRVTRAALTDASECQAMRSTVESVLYGRH